jgi:large subunit ribosomal protein L23
MPVIDLKPVVSEKSLGQADKLHTYCFIVPGFANKIELAAAVAKQFGVKVATVNTTNIKGKPKVSARRDGRRKPGKRSDYKKAYVTLEKGQTIKLFEGAI